MAIIKVHVTAEDKRWLERVASFHGMTVSDLMKNYSMNQLEDEYDARIAKVSYDEFVKHGSETVSMEDVIKEFG